MNTVRTSDITIPLDQEAHSLAEKFAIQQATPQRGRQVYLNTLAVYGVHRYLKWLQIDTDLNQSDSWHPELQVVSNVADLVIPNLGKLECCPILPGETSFVVDSEIITDRIGYLAVQFGETLDQVKLLGFINQVDSATNQIYLSDLQPLEVFLDYVSDLLEAKSKFQITDK